MLRSPREVLRERARTTPGRRAFVFLDDAGAEAASLTDAELHAAARGVAARLAEHARPGDRALLCFAPGLDFLAAFFGCLEAGVIAVPVAPPRRGRVAGATGQVVVDAEPAVVLADVTTAVAAADALGGGDVPCLVVDAAEVPADGAGVGGSPDPDAVAFLQYTSGSTSAPKGVVVTHGNLAANEEMIRRAFGHDGTSTFVGWAPLFHDQGLIGNVLQPLHLGTLAVLMAPSTFVRRPLSWPLAISRYRARTSGGPDFAFAACVAAARHAGLPEGLDLSCWTVAFDGAEPLRASTLRDFAATFAPAGFDPGALYPCYGLAEATLLVTGSRPGRGPVLLDVDPESLAGGHLTPASPGGPSRTLVGSGEILAGEDVRVVDPATGEGRGEGEVGEIRVSGPHVTAGYWRRTEATAANWAPLPDAPHGRFLRTGDLGALVDGELYVVGRLRDMVVVRGRNHHPGDVEATVADARAAHHPALAPAGPATVALVGVADEEGGDERAVVVAELAEPPEGPKPTQPAGTAAVAVAGTLRAAVLAEHDLTATVVLVRAGTLPRTSSGKIRRGSVREAYLAGRLAAWAPAAVAETPTP